MNYKESNPELQNTVVILCRAEEGLPIEYMSESIQQLGYLPDFFDAGQKSFSQIIHTEDRDAFLKEVSEFHRNGCRDFSRELKILTILGETKRMRARVINLRSMYKEMNRYIGLLIETADVEQKEIEWNRIQEALKISRQKYEDIANLAPVGFFLSNLDGTLISVNNALVQMLGYGSVDELLRVNLESTVYLCSEDRKKILLKIKASDSITNAEIQWRKKDGSSIWIQLDARVIKDEQGTIIRKEGFVRDITMQKKTDEKLYSRLEIEGLLSSISADFISLLPDEIDRAINSALQTIGSFAGVDRSYVFLFSIDEKYMDNTHEWCAEGIEPQIQNLKNLPVDIFPWWMDKLNKFENIYVPNVDDLPIEAAAEKDILKAQDILSVLVVPLVYKGVLKGFLGFDSVRDKKAWPEEDIRILKIAAEIFTNARVRKEAEEALIQRDKILEAVGFTAEKILSSGNWEMNIIDILARLGETMGVRRSYILDNQTTEEGICASILRFEWVRGGTDARPDGSDWERSPVVIDVLNRWSHKLRIGVIISQNVQDCDDDLERKFFESQGIQSLLHLPIIVGGKCWGVLGFDECLTERSWSEAEMEALRMAAGAIGAAIERKRYEEELVSAKEKAETSDRLKDVFLANLSHEIRSPINIILGYADIIKEITGESDVDKTEYLTRIIRAGNRLNRLVENLINLSCIQTNTYKFLPEYFDLGIMSKKLSLDMQPFAQEKELTIFFESQPCNSSFWIFADQYAIEQALINLIENALKFTPSGGIFIRVYKDAEHIFVEIQDTGVGISEEFLPNIFDRFSQEVYGHTRPFDGMGLGLALVKQYIVANNGEIGIQSSKGAGTKFNLKFPEAKFEV